MGRKLYGMKVDAHQHRVIRYLGPVIAVQLLFLQLQDFFRIGFFISLCRDVLRKGSPGCNIHTLQSQTEAGYKVARFFCQKRNKTIVLLPTQQVKQETQLK